MAWLMEVEINTVLKAGTIGFIASHLPRTNLVDNLQIGR